MEKKKRKYILVEWRDIGYGYNIPLKYFPKHRKGKRGRGQPDKFKSEYIRIVGICCRELGAEIKQLCRIFNCVPSVLYTWMYKYPEFKKAIKDNMDMWNIHKVERTLLARALGIEYTEVKKEIVKINTKYKGKKIKIPGTKVTKYKKFIPGDPSCLFFYLQNRDPERWRNTKYLQLSGKVETDNKTTIQLEDLRKLDKKDIVKLKDVYNKMNKSDGTLKRSLEA